MFDDVFVLLLVVPPTGTAHGMRGTVPLLEGTCPQSRGAVKQQC